MGVGDRRSGSLTVLVIALSAVVAVSSAAQAGPLDPDPKFGGDGRARWGPLGYSYPGAMVADGRRVHLASVGSSTSDSAFMVVSTLGRRGRLISSRYHGPGGFPDVADILLAPNHGVIVVGYSRYYDYSTGSPELISARPFAIALHRDLSLRRSFGKRGDGLAAATLLPNLAMDTVTGASLDSQGRVAIVGERGGDVVIARLRRNGRPDRSLGTNGVRRIVTHQHNERPVDMSLDSQGRILVVGEDYRGGRHLENFVARYGLNGSPSGQWRRGIMRHFNSHLWRPEQLIVKPTDRLLIGFSSQKASHVRITQLTARGVADSRHFTSDAKVNARCVHPPHLTTLSELTFMQTRGGKSRIAAFMNCKRSSGVVQRAAGWNGHGRPLSGFGPNGVGRLPWQEPIVDAVTVPGDRYVLAHTFFLARLGTH